MCHIKEQIQSYLNNVATPATREMYDYFTAKGFLIEEIRDTDYGVSFCFRSPHEDYSIGAHTKDDWFAVEIGISDCYVGGTVVNWESKRMFLDSLIPTFLDAIARIPEYDETLN